MYNIAISIVADTKDLDNNECFGVLVCAEGKKVFAPPTIFKSDNIDDLEQKVKDEVDDFFKSLRKGKRNGKR